MNTFTDAAVISFLILTILMSAKLCFTIYKHISEKAPIDQTIIDFIYRECILYIHLLTASLCIAVISCLVSEGFALDYELALLYANPIFFFICSAAILLTVSSCLRLLSIVNVSEEAGIQLLGTDDAAITKIRWMYFSISVFILLFGQLVLKCPPPSVTTLVIAGDTVTVPMRLDNEPGIFIYLFPPLMAATLNFSTTVVRI